jgi:hypothetical protein
MKILIALLFPLSLLAAQSEHEGPCKQIKEACEKAGFVKGEAKQGKGLWMDCIDPLMQGTTAKKSVLPLPSVDASVIAACKQKHPKFGSGKVAN